MASRLPERTRIVSLENYRGLLDKPARLITQDEVQALVKDLSATK